MTERRITSNNSFASIAPFLIGLDALTQHGLDTLSKTIPNNSFPPHNLDKIDDDTFKITLAIAGFKKSDVTVSFKDSTLTITGKAPKVDKEYESLHRGIASRDWERTFKLGEYIEVTEVTMVDGLLEILLVRNVPDSAKPKVFEIK